MATRTVTTYTDDIDGTEGAETVRFSLEGTTFEIDLNQKNLGDLREALHPFISNGRRINTAAAAGTPRRASSGGAASRDYDPKVVRTWAAAQSIDVPARGRVPSKVLDAYREANAGA